VDAVLARLGLADRWAIADSPLGEVAMAWNSRGVSWIGAAPGREPEARALFEHRVSAELGRPVVGGTVLPARLRSAIERRLAGDRRARVRVDLRGRTDFERAVLETAARIPYGEVRPYGWLAAEIGRPAAVRAVGTALAHNPVPLVVPCHRVVRSDGHIGQYSLGGPDAKRTILMAEGLDPDALEADAQRGIRFVGSATTRIVCLPTCHHARRISARHRRPFASLREAESSGYRACRHCRPGSAAVLAA
jgi:O-6-methylguanine DNA methyltransferase